MSIQATADHSAKCLTQARIDRQVERIASGFETNEQVADKRKAIRRLRPRAC
jgi:hypothetical protein